MRGPGAVGRLQRLMRIVAERDALQRRRLAARRTARPPGPATSAPTASSGRATRGQSAQPRRAVAVRRTLPARGPSPCSTRRNAKPAVVQDVGGLGRPRRDRAQPRHHPQRRRFRFAGRCRSTSHRRSRRRATPSSVVRRNRVSGLPSRCFRMARSSSWLSRSRRNADRAGSPSRTIMAGRGASRGTRILAEAPDRCDRQARRICAFERRSARRPACRASRSAVQFAPADHWADCALLRFTDVPSSARTVGVASMPSDSPVPWFPRPDWGRSRCPDPCRSSRRCTPPCGRAEHQTASAALAAPGWMSSGNMHVVDADPGGVVDRRRSSCGTRGSTGNRHR